MTRLALLVLAALVTLHMLGRRFRVEPRDPAPSDVYGYVPMAAWDDALGMCPHCVTPWKCNGPHIIEDTAWYRLTKAAGRN